MSAQQPEDFESQVYAYVGREVCPRQPAKDAVNAAMIRHWAEAMGDSNPAYLDPDWATASRRGRLIAPPAMMYVWNQEGIKVATEGRPSDAQSDLVELFNAHGYIGTLGTNVIQEYVKEVSPGDTVYMEMVIDNISERKSTGRGDGYFFETLATFSDQDGDVIGTQRFRVLKFMPPEGAAGGAMAFEPPDPGELQPATTPRRDTLSCADIKPADTLPPLQIPVSTGLIVGSALATRDFEKVHHDKAVAQSTGLPDVFMNILTSQGLMTRFVTDWSGPEAVVKSLSIKLGAPNLPGMVMTISGEVSSVDPGSRSLEVQVRGDNNAWGNHMSGTVTLELPE
jgi:acyl dehydratase